jgi:hypothetical protein
MLESRPGADRARGAASRVRRRARLFRARFAGRAFESRIVWIFGSPRSGSTWLLRLLGEHPAVAPMNEPLIGLYLSPFLCDLPGFEATTLDSDTFSIRTVQARKPAQFFAEEFRPVWNRTLRRLIRERFMAHLLRFPASKRASETLLLVKEPSGSQSADLIMGALPRSRLLFLLRDGRDVVDSELAANSPGSWISQEFPGARGIGADDRLEFVTKSACKWLWRTEVVEAAFARHSGPKLLVRYEDLRRESLQQVRAVYDWLGLAVDEADLRDHVERHSFEQLPEGARGPLSFFRSSEPGAWRTNLSPEEQAAVERIIGPKLRKLGYSA